MAQGVGVVPAEWMPRSIERLSHGVRPVGVEGS
jgi:hypothetical protein